MLSHKVPFTRSMAFLKSSPQPFKTPRRRARILHCVRYVPVPEAVRNEPRVEPFIRQVEPRRVAQHVRVDGEGKSGPQYLRRLCA